MPPIDPASTTLGVDAMAAAANELVPAVLPVLAPSASLVAPVGAQPSPTAADSGSPEMAMAPPLLVSRRGGQGEHCWARVGPRLMMGGSGVVPGGSRLAGATLVLREVQDAVAVLNRSVTPTFEVS